MQHRSVYLVVILLVTVLIMSACAPFKPAPISPSTVVPPTPRPTPTIIPPTSTPISGNIDVGGYKLRIRCAGQGTPSVIIDSGLGDPAASSGGWRVVTSEIAKTTQICLYDRAGLGGSNPAPGQYQSSRTSQDMVNDLHTLLVNANVAAPYILVGASIGGYNAHLYAGQYPKEVAGVVLVDSAHPDQWSEILAVLPPEEPTESYALQNLRSSTNPLSNNENLDVNESAAQVRAIKSLGDLPIVVLTRTPGLIFPDLPPDLSAKIDQIWQDLQIDLTGLSSNSTQMIATQAGHDIAADEPQLVIDAILKVISQAKK